MTTEPALQLTRLTKTFGTTRAVDSLDLTVRRGAVYGFIGPSGAGKTTCIRMIMAILFPDSGTLTVLGKSSALDAKDRIGYLPEERGVYRKMKVDAFLSYIGQLKGVSAAAAAARGAALLERLGLAAVGAKRCEELSKGMLQRVQFVAAIINQPELLILDEPFSGLDPVSVRLLKDVIADEGRRGASILFSTHVMAHAEEMCQHVVMMHRGRKVLDEPMSGLRRQFDARTIRFEPLSADADLTRLRTLPGVRQLTPTADGCELRLHEGVDTAGVIQDIVALVPPARVELARVRLEDVFVRLVTDSAGHAESEQALRANLQGMSTEGAAV
jgi:ABC-2 type transport system ATP-binding protein